MMMCAQALSNFLFVNIMRSNSTTNNTYWSDIFNRIVSPQVQKGITSTVDSVRDRDSILSFTEWSSAFKQMFYSMPSLDVLAYQLNMPVGVPVTSRQDIFVDLMFIAAAPGMLYGYLLYLQQRSKADYYQIRISELAMRLYFVQLFDYMYNASSSSQAIILNSFNDIISTTAVALDESNEISNTYSVIQDVHKMSSNNKATLQGVIDSGANLSNSQNRLMAARGREGDALARRKKSIIYFVIWVILGTAVVSTNVVLIMQGNYINSLYMSSMIMTVLAITWLVLLFKS
jgi:hypothetical protein